MQSNLDENTIHTASHHYEIKSRNCEIYTVETR